MGSPCYLNLLYDVLIVFIVSDKIFLTSKYNLPAWDENLRKKLLSG